MYKEVVLGGDVWDLLDELMIYMGNPMQYYEKDVAFVRVNYILTQTNMWIVVYSITLTKLELSIVFIFESGCASFWTSWNW